MSKLPFRLLDRWDMVAKKRVNLCLLLGPVTHLPLPGISGPWDSFATARSPRILKKLVKHLTGEQNINRVTSRWMKITWKCSPWWMKITWKWSPCIVLQRDVTVERHWENSVAANYWLALEMSAILKLVAVAGLISALGVKRKRETEYFLSFSLTLIGSNLKGQYYDLCYCCVLLSTSSSHFDKMEPEIFCLNRIVL